MDGFYDYDRIKLRFRAFRHKSMVHSLSGVMPYYVINEFPKSGGSWLAEMVSEATCMPFRRNEPIRVEPCVTHGHFLRPYGLRNVIVLWRDPRDTMVSLYYHCFFTNEFGNDKLVSVMKKHLPFANYDDIQKNLSSFIDFMALTPDTPSFSWGQFADVWAERPGTVQVRYEDLRLSTASELVRVVNQLTGELISNETAKNIASNHTLAMDKARVAKKANSKFEVSFIREGAVGGWKKYFTSESLETINSLFGRQMEKLGYTCES